MSQKNKQFGVWMDTHHAIVVGRADAFKKMSAEQLVEYIDAKFN